MNIRYKCLISYVGTQYCGWQVQEKAKPPPTIQGELERILKKVMGRPVRVHGAGRTDSGVHADGQVAHWDAPAEKAHYDWRRIFNAQLPRDIAVRHVEAVCPSFHSRFDAKAKTYHYTLWTDKSYVPPRLRPFVWDCGAVNIEAMRAALPALCGTHDFASLQNVGTPIDDTQRTISAISLESVAPSALFVPHSADTLLQLRVTADGFLKQMVRNIVGLLVAIGQDKCAASDIAMILAAADRRKAPPTAPPQGLSLHKVYYEDARNCL